MGTALLVSPKEGMSFLSTSKVKQVTVNAVVIRNNGKREDLGTVAYFHSNPLRRLWFALKQNLR